MAANLSPQPAPLVIPEPLTAADREALVALARAAEAQRATDQAKYLRDCARVAGGGEK